mmetsp:Transcript_25927/g.56844  ORF Transcript_25927/g.56844 Transcript_25927/m.56844 type:complete len:396 (+) Transcript_25927:294-1481(+)
MSPIARCCSCLARRGLLCRKSIFTRACTVVLLMAAAQHSAGEESTGPVSISKDPEAAVPAALTVSDGSSQTYLLFDVVFHEQLNKQRRALMFFFDLARQTKRVLVLPRARLLRRAGASARFAPEAEYVRWGDLFNLSVINKLHPAIELETFVEAVGRIDLLVPDGSQACTAAAEQQVLFNGLHLLAARTECQRGLQHQLHSLLARDARAIAFRDVTNQLGAQRVAPLRPYVRFTQGVYDRAADFVAASFGDAPFVAVHWRRTDFLQVRRSQPGVLQSAQHLVEHVKRAMEKYRIQHVYLATDSDDKEELAYVDAMLQPARYKAPRAEGRDSDLRVQVDVANVEIAICASARFFLGTKTSSYTLAIIEERTAVFGHKPDSAVEMGVLRAYERKDEL